MAMDEAQDTQMSDVDRLKEHFCVETDANLADKLLVSRSTVTNWRTRGRTPTRYTRVLDGSPDWRAKPARSAVIDQLFNACQAARLKRAAAEIVVIEARLKRDAAEADYQKFSDAESAAHEAWRAAVTAETLAGQPTTDPDGMVPAGQPQRE